MHNQLDSARKTPIDVLWWTDHDWRMSAQGYRQAVHFTSLKETENGAPVTWKKVTSGGSTLTSSAMTIVTSPASPLDPVTPASSMSVTGVGTGTAFSTVRGVATGARDNLRSTLAGQQIALEVYPQQVGPNTMCEIRVLSSTHPATGGRPAGQYTLSYRIGGPDAPGTRKASGITGIVVLPGTAGTWNSIVLNPEQDAAAIWPDIQSQDLSMCELSLGVQSRGGTTARAFYDYLRFTRTVDNGHALTVQRQLAATYAPAYPTVTQHIGLEVSLYEKHINWFGGDVALPDYGTLRINPTIDDPAATANQIAMIHAAGGIASFNHMFGTGNSLVADAEQEKRRKTVSSQLITTASYGADLLEVGYRQRGGVNLPRHLAAWDACSRNAVFLTGTGVSDDHSGGGWKTSIRNFYTYAWAPDTSEDSLIAALRAGRCFFGDVLRFTGQLDLLVDGVGPMGSVTVSSLATRTVRVTATNVPSGGRVNIVRGPTDLAGPSQPEPATVVTTMPASALTTGPVDVTVTPGSGCFIRTEVCDATGLIIAGSNPVWLLPDPSSVLIPPDRSV